MRAIPATYGYNHIHGASFRKDAKIRPDNVLQFGATQTKTYTPFPLKEMYHAQVAEGATPLPKIRTEDIAQGTYVWNYPQFEVKHDLKHAIATSGLWQCAGLMMIDKASNKHYLAHISHVTGKDDILKHLAKVDIDPKKSEIYILPGCYKETEHTVGQIMDALSQVSPLLPDKVKFVYLPQNTYCVVSYDGQVWALEGNAHQMDRGGQNIQLSGNYRPGFWKH
jgi:hypothetical protein